MRCSLSKPIDRLVSSTVRFAEGTVFGNLALPTRLRTLTAAKKRAVPKSGWRRLSQDNVFQQMIFNYNKVRLVDRVFHTGGSLLHSGGGGNVFCR